MNIDKEKIDRIVVNVIIDAIDSGSPPSCLESMKALLAQGRQLYNMPIDLLMPVIDKAVKTINVTIGNMTSFTMLAIAISLNNAFCVTNLRLAPTFNRHIANAECDILDMVCLIAKFSSIS